MLSMRTDSAAKMYNLLLNRYLALTFSIARRLLVSRARQRLLGSKRSGWGGWLGGHLCLAFARFWRSQRVAVQGGWLDVNTPILEL